VCDIDTFLDFQTDTVLETGQGIKEKDKYKKVLNVVCVRECTHAFSRDICIDLLSSFSSYV